MFCFRDGEAIADRWWFVVVVLLFLTCIIWLCMSWYVYGSDAIEHEVFNRKIRQDLVQTIERRKTEFDLHYAATVKGHGFHGVPEVSLIVIKKKLEQQQEPEKINLADPTIPVDHRLFE